MIPRRRFLKLIAGGLVASQLPATLLAGWGSAVDLPGEVPNPEKGNFQFDDTPGWELRAALLSVDGTGEQVILHLSAAATCFEPLPCAEGDGQLAAAVDAIHHLTVSGTVVEILYLLAQGSSENLPRVAELAAAGRSIGLFTVALIVETQDTDANQWSTVCAEAGIDSLNLISSAALGPDAAMEPQFAHQPLELACLTALRSHTEYFRV